MTIRHVAILTMSLIAVFAGCGRPREGSSDSAMQCGSLRIWLSAGGFVIPPPDAPEAAFRWAELHQTQTALGHVSYSAERFCVEHGRYPASFSELIEADSAIPYYTPCRFELLSAPTDAWDRPVVYELEGSTPKIYSLGRDGVAGTPDDVRVKVGEDPTSETTAIDAYKDCDLRDSA